MNNPGNGARSTNPRPRAVAGGTPTDLVFPFFLFIVGVTTHLPLTSRREAGADDRAIMRKIISRGMLIILFGLLLNAFPFFWWGRIADNPDPTFLQRVIYRFDHLRWAGVLQRIGIVYLIAALLTVKLNRRQIIITIAAILIGYWMILALIPVPGTGRIGALTLNDPPNTLAAWSDRVILARSTSGRRARRGSGRAAIDDPRGRHRAFGVLAGQWIANKRRPLQERVLECWRGGGRPAGGSLWARSFRSTESWTSSYVVFTAGFACIALATCIWLIDVHQVRRWTKRS